MPSQTDYHAICGPGIVYQLATAALNVEDVLDELPPEPHVAASLAKTAEIVDRCLHRIRSHLATPPTAG